MSPTTTLPEIVSGLYEIAAAPGGPAAFGAPGPSPLYAYFLTASAPVADAPVTLEDLWGLAPADLQARDLYALARPDLTGWYLFVGAPITPALATAFAAAARTALPGFDGTALSPRTLAWLAAADPATLVAWLPLAWLGGTSVRRTPIARQAGAYAFAWPPLSLTLRSGVSVVFDAARGTLRLTTDAGSSDDIALSNPGLPPGWYEWYAEDGGSWVMDLPLDGASPGGFRTRLGLDFGALMAVFGCAPRYFHDDGASLVEIAYPFYPPRPLGQPMPGFALSLHPLWPTDARHTVLALDFGDGSPPNPFQATSATLRAPYFLTPTGATLTLAPVPGGGFSFCTAPDPATSPGSTRLYLAPVGTHRVIDTGPLAPGDGARWMCGLTGLEHVEVAMDDLVALHAPMPALVRAQGGDGEALDPTYTTAWIRYPVTGGPRRYFGQPSASVYFGTVPGGDFARPVQALLATVEDGAIFPLAPYGGLGTAGAAPAAATLAAIEAQGLTAARHARLTAASPGPVFLGGTTLGLLAEDGPASAETRQGFVVGLNPDGTWNRVDFARSPDRPDQILGLVGDGSPGLVRKAIAQRLMADQLFLVVSDATQLGEFRQEIALDGFTFRLDVGRAGPVDADTTILIFKYDTRSSLRDLASAKGPWMKDAFVRDPEGTYAQIALALQAADRPAPSRHRAFRAGSGAGAAEQDPFAEFRRIAGEAGWTGFIALNCSIDGNAMPADLQMLLGGVDGPLRAHHLGLQSNTLETTGGRAAIVQSSLFGVISYPSSARPPPPPDPLDDFAYALERLTVVFHNSTIADFDARVGLTVNRLFGRAVALVSGPASPAGAAPSNTLAIAGRYQIQGGIATVTFLSDQAFVYGVPVPEGTARVLRQVAFDRAALVPVSSSPAGSPAPASPEGVDVKARFNLSGALWFNAAPFAQAPGFDLFSFGDDPATDMTKGLGFEGLAVDIAFTLGPGGGIMGKRSVTGDFSALTPTAGKGSIRRNSLLDGLPLQLSTIIAPPGGFTAASLGAAPVHVLQLEPPPAIASPAAGSPAAVPAAPPPNVTQAPQYGLAFDMPLGSLGALSNATVGLMAKLVIGWGASRLVPETDAVAVLVQLPQAFAGYGSFQLQGILKTVFGDANLLRVERHDGAPVYAVLFNNVQLSVLGKSFPIGLAVDFLIFAGPPDGTASGNAGNLAWFLGATGAAQSPTGVP